MLLYAVIGIAGWTTYKYVDHKAHDRRRGKSIDILEAIDLQSILDEIYVGQFRPEPDLMAPEVLDPIAARIDVGTVQRLSLNMADELTGSTVDATLKDVRENGGDLHGAHGNRVLALIRPFGVARNAIIADTIWKPSEDTSGHRSRRRRR